MSGFHKEIETEGPAFSMVGRFSQRRPLGKGEKVGKRGVMEKLLVSGCLLGHPCRYDGKAKRNEAVCALRENGN